MKLGSALGIRKCMRAFQATALRMPGNTRDLLKIAATLPFLKRTRNIVDKVDVTDMLLTYDVIFRSTKAP